MKYRIHKWGCMSPPRDSYGLQAQAAKGQRYMHVCDTVKGVKRAMIYETKKRAEEVCAALNAGETPDMEKGLVPLPNAELRDRRESAPSPEK